MMQVSVASVPRALIGWLMMAGMSIWTHNLILENASFSI
jgi:hypothetical protein